MKSFFLNSINIQFPGNRSERDQKEQVSLANNLDVLQRPSMYVIISVFQAESIAAVICQYFKLMNTAAKSSELVPTWTMFCWKSTKFKGYQDLNVVRFRNEVYKQLIIYLRTYMLLNEFIAVFCILGFFLTSFVCYHVLCARYTSAYRLVTQVVYLIVLLQLFDFNLFQIC